MSADDPRDPDNQPESYRPPETVSELADLLTHWLSEQGFVVASPEQVAEETKDSPLYADAEPGWDLGQAFLGVRLPNGTEISIALGLTE